METDRFKQFMPIILEHEGGFVNNKLDPGGATKYGISLRYLKSVGDFNGDGWMDGDLDHDGDVDIDDILKLTPETARPFFFNSFYNPMKIESLLQGELALQVFDFGVNAGAYRAIKTLQQVLQIKADGVIGPNTLHFANTADFQTLTTLYRMERIDYYRLLVKQKPQRETFLAGWINRANHCKLK